MPKNLIPKLLCPYKSKERRYHGRPTEKPGLITVTGTCRDVDVNQERNIAELELVSN